VFNIIRLTETVSTNTEAMRRALSGESLPFWVTAERQTGGKGRSGRTWVSEPGNLHASLAIAPGCEPARVAELSLVAGVAFAETVRALAATTPAADLAAIRLKWPNDLLVHHAKCGGILVETATDLSADKRLVAVIGFGLNLVIHPSDIGQGATHLKAEGIDGDAHAALAKLAEAMDAALRTWDRGEGFAKIRTRWLQAALPRREPMRINTGDRTVEGTFAGLDLDGALMLRDTAGRIQRFTFGDVTLPAR
jgi:BirA family transcriptional regulator, biotin operon repressor / biotin---[acetyl-CoA-carboxylase] ligase